MPKFYSPTTRGFYDPAIGAPPPDAIEIAEELHASLLEAQSAGQAIVPDRNGLPMATDPVALMTEQERVRMRIGQLELQVTARRLREALLTQEGAAWLKALEQQIAQLRAAAA